MKIGSDCSSDCIVCGVEYCLAGHGDNDYERATKEQLLKRLELGKRDENPSRRQYTIVELKYIKEKLLDWYGVNKGV